MGDHDYGTRTLGSGGVPISESFQIKPLKNSLGGWARPTFLAMKQQADVIFILTEGWGGFRYKTEDAAEWSESKRKKWDENVMKARAMFAKENSIRRSKGQPPRVIPYGDWGLVRTYLPNAPRPPNAKYHFYTPKEILAAFVNTHNKWAPKSRSKKKDKYSINVIHFVRENTSVNASDKERYSKLVNPTRGDYRVIKGMEAIKSYVESEKSQ